MQTTESDVRIARLNDGYRLTTALFVPRSRESIFSFFADALNLESITPPWLRFRVVTPTPIEMRQGTVIDYRLRLHHVPIRWQSRISAWEPPHRFVDEQVRGPYRKWHHEHIFEEVDGGTLCRDIVDYAAAGGRLVNSLFVKRDLIRIFTFRREKLIELLSVRDS